MADDQHEQCAHPHHRVAQAHGERGADDRLHEGGVGGQAREHLAGLRGLEELWALAQHMGIHRVAQVGRDALAQPADQIEARSREDAQRHGHGEQLQEVTAQAHGLGGAVGGQQAAVDQPAQRHRKEQGGGRGQHQEQAGQRDLGAVGAGEGQQGPQGLRRLRLGAGRGSVGAHGEPSVPRNRGVCPGARAGRSGPGGPVFQAVATQAWPKSRWWVCSRRAIRASTSATNCSRVACGVRVTSAVD